MKKIIILMLLLLTTISYSQIPHKTRELLELSKSTPVTHIDTIIGQTSGDKIVKSITYNDFVAQLIASGFGAGGSGITSIVQDLTPQFGADVDLNDFDFTRSLSRTFDIKDQDGNSNFRITGRTNTNTLTTQFGDVDGLGNATSIFLNDATGLIGISGTGNINIGNGPINLNSNAVSNAMSIADISTLGNSSVITKDYSDNASQNFLNKTINADNNTISNISTNEFDTDTKDSFRVINKTTLDNPDIDVSSNGTTISLSIEKIGGGDIRVNFSDGTYLWDTSPADVITLTAGSDSSNQLNYVYLLHSTKLITVSTTGFPVAEHLKIATVLCQSAASLQTQKAMKVHAWIDHLDGHIVDLNYWIRHQPATSWSGGAITPTVGLNIFDIAISSTLTLQLHEHLLPAFNTATGSKMFILNHPDVANKVALDLTQSYLDKDANGTILGDANSDYYNIVVGGIISEKETDSKIFINTPDGAYKDNVGGKAVNDVDRTAIYTIPPEYLGAAILIAKLTVSESGGTYTIENIESLIGKTPSTAASGGGGITSSEFIDNTFRVGAVSDITKQLGFIVSGITSGTVKYITMPDADVDLGEINTLSSTYTSLSTYTSFVLKTAPYETAPGTNTLTSVSLHTSGGSNYTTNTHNAAIFTISNTIGVPVTSGFAKWRINRATEPTVTETDNVTTATKIKSTFIANTTMWVVAYYEETEVYYYFLEII